MMSRRKLAVHFTIDTETSMGGAWADPACAPLPLDRPVFGKLASRFYGIPLIMDILEEHGFRGTFFTEVFCSYSVGRDEVAKACRSILERGHDCQLHLHPIYRFYRDRQAGKPAREIDFMFQLSRDEQHEFIGEGVELFCELTGKPPRAFRAGCYAGSEAITDVLTEHGIAIDSSYNLAYLGQTCGFGRQGLNAPTLIGSVYEFPVTVFRVAGATGHKPLEISAVSVKEVLATLAALRRAGCRNAVLVLHSFSLLKNLGRRFERCTPDQIVTQRVRRLCAALAQLRDDIEVCPLGDIDLRSVPVPQPHVIPVIGWVQPAMRKLVQAANRLPWL
jgi:hypothetical protein